MNPLSRSANFHSGEIQAQDRWGIEGLWDEKRVERLIWSSIPEEFHARIESAPFFFMATSGRDETCDCSFKGGGPGLIKILAADRIAFPDFDGNGAFMSLGNILQNPNVGLLFIDFNDGARLRVNGKASIRDNGEMMAFFPDASRVVIIDIDQVVPNCPKHIPRLQPATDRA